MIPAYTVKSDNGLVPWYWVATVGANGREYPVTHQTRNSEQAEQWRIALRRAAQINEDRRATAKGTRR